MHLPAHAKSKHQAGAAGEPAHVGGGTALVVDDEAHVRRILSRMLERLDFRVTEAASAHEALEIFREHAPDIEVVLLDIRMPDMNGWECLRELRAIRDDVAVIVCSGHAPGGPGARPAEPGLAFLAKPFRIAALRETLDRLSRGRQSH